MEPKQLQWLVSGMNRDTSVSKYDPKFAYEIKNLRLNSVEGNTMLSWVSEKGPKNTNLIIQDDTEEYLTPIGTASICDKIIVFATNSDDSRSYIYEVYITENDKLVYEELFQGALGFKKDHPIETLSFYENENAVKVYWVDGINQPRMININGRIDPENINQFDFVSTLQLKENILIGKEANSSGVFQGGTIQYVFTYYTKFGAETNIFYASPLLYTSHNNRGASPEDTSVDNSFNITMNRLDANFDYVRVYSIQRTSLNATPLVKRVVDIPLDQIQDNKFCTLENGRMVCKIVLKDDDSGLSLNPIHKNDHTVGGTVTFVDNNTYGDTIDPTLLLYVGGKDIIAGTLAQKDNTLFLGNITENRLLNENFESLKDTYEDKIQEDLKVLNEFDDANPFEGTYYAYKNQLDKTSRDITHFKTGEWYRLGLQLQKKTGEWSEPVFLKDKLVHSKIDTSVDKDAIGLPFFKLPINKSDFEEYINKGYKAVRPLVVYPTFNDRRVVCQGVLNPTVFNALLRKSNAPYAQSSWFFRPTPPQALPNPTEGPAEGNYQLAPTSMAIIVRELDDYEDFGVKTNEMTIKVLQKNCLFDRDFEKKNDFNNVVYSKTVKVNYNIEKADIIVDGNKVSTRVVVVTPDNGIDADAISNSFSFPYGRCILEYTYGVSPLRAVITHYTPYRTFSSYKLTSSNGKIKANVSIDEEIVSVQGIKLDGAPYTYSANFNKSGFISDNTAPPVPGYSQNLYGLEYRHLNALPNSDQMNSEIQSQRIQKDHLIYDKNYTQYDLASYFVDRSIVTLHSPEIEFDTNIYNFDECNHLSYNIVGYVPITSSAGDTSVKVSRASYWPAGGFSRTLISIKNISKDAYKGMTINANWKDGEYKSEAKEQLSPLYNWPLYPWHRNGSLNNQDAVTEDINNKDNNVKLRYSKLDQKKMSNIRFSTRPIYMENKPDLTIQSTAVFSSNELSIIKCGNDSYYGNVDSIIDTLNAYPVYRFVNEQLIIPSGDTTSTDPISMKYKSTPHIVTRLDDILPESLEGNIQYGYLPLVDLINSNNEPLDEDDKAPLTLFGGTSKEAIRNNMWLPAGDSVLLEEINEDSILSWDEGDTYFQRYDCLKTYPFTKEDQNSIVDILSFMCETHVNIDGRYDRNRGQTDNLNMSPEIFNLLNPVYSQRNNFFSYRVLDNDLFNTNNYPYTITWTKTKTPGEKIDQWTNITLANSINMDGDKGNLTAIRKFNDNLIVFQDKALSHILYNEQQLQTTEGVPLEIANSGKVTGKRTIASNIGCNNKWSICTTENALYFIDGYNKSIYQFSDKLNNISTTSGFHSWLYQQGDNLMKSWDPDKFNNFVAHYDHINKEVLFISKNHAVAFYELFNCFTSFYDYNNEPYLISIGDKLLWLRSNGELWEHNTGDYNNFFGVTKPYWMTYIASADPTTDKVFNTVEFRADVVDSNDKLISNITQKNKIQANKLPFSKLEVWNEYQYGSHSFTARESYNTSWRRNVRQKFRIWRALVPRDNKRHLDRIRNPWAYIKLINDSPDSNKTIIHDVVCKYFNM